MTIQRTIFRQPPKAGGQGNDATWIDWWPLWTMLVLLLLSAPSKAMLALPVSEPESRLEQRYWPDNYQPRYPQQLHDLYRQREGGALWFSAEQAFDARQELRWQLLELALAGAPSRFEAWLRQIEATGKASVDSDAIYTDAFIGILMLHQALTSRDYDQAMSLQALATVPLSAPPEITEGLLSANSEVLLRQLQSLQGDRESTRRSRQHIVRLLELDLAQQHWPQVNAGPLLRPGARSGDVRLIRWQLHLLGYPDVTAQEHSEDVLDAPLVAAVEQFQRQHGLKVDGIIGSQTRHWLNASPLVRARLLARNQLRMQLFQQYRTEQQVVVNLPAFELGLYRQGELQLRSRVIVGRQSRPSPLLQSKISNVVLNPAWNVPRSILRKDILPKLRDDPEYLVRERFELIRYDGLPVDYAAEGWQELLHEPGFPFRLQQRPGAGNALGAYKFHFDNHFAVYLHDTPSSRLFTEAERSFSSGCIRVEQAEQLANYLFRQTGYSAAYTDSLLNAGKTRWLRLNRSVPIFTVYWTAWIDASGQPQYRNDIYHLDAAVWEHAFPLAASTLKNFSDNNALTYLSGG